jgi:hypothetical protein
MSLKSSPKAPPAPDPAVVAGLQTGANIDSAIANSYIGNANVNSPYGSTTFNKTGSVNVDGHNVPRFTQNIKLSPGQQKLLNQQQAIGGKMNDLALSQTARLQRVLGQPIDTRGLAGWNTGPNAPRLARSFEDVGDPTRTLGPSDYEGARTKVEEAIYSRLNPQLDRDRASLESDLVNQGFHRGTEAFDNKMREFREQSNDARMQAVLAGGQEQSRLFGMDLSRGQFENAAQQQAYDQALNRATFGNNADIQQFGLGQQDANFDNALRGAQFQEKLAIRNQPINEISALMAGGQVTLPQFQSFRGGTVEPAPIGQYTYNTANLNQQAYNTQANQKAATLGGLYGLGATAIGAGGRMFSPFGMR